MCERKTNTRSPALSDNSNLYSWCVYYQEGYNGHNSVNIKILYFPAFTSFNLDIIQVNLDKKVMQLLSIKGGKKRKKNLYFQLNRFLDWTLVTHVRDSYWTEFPFAFENIISIEYLVIKIQTLLLCSFFFLEFSRYFSITIIATNITNPFMVLPNVSYIYFRYLSNWMLC